MTDYYDPHIKLNNLASALQSPRFQLVQADILDVDLPEKLHDVRVIFHLAGQPGVRASWGERFPEYMRNNVLATQRLLECAKESRSLEKFVFSSSSSVYGEAATENVNEDAPTRPQSPYGITKLAAEKLCSLYADVFHLPMVLLRLFSVYGPRQRPDMAFVRLIDAALQDKTFTVYGDGTQKRDYTYVDDAVEGLLLAAKMPQGVGVFNLGGGHASSLDDVIGMVETIAGKPINVHRIPAQRGDVKRTSADITKIGQVLGFQPSWHIKDGLERQVSFQRHSEKS